ncbi:MAG: Flp pilus assembly complex ATPase component TadA [Rhodospirillum sp.]|nr:Flp pilus assembly complex ATPase component TadA [Rhodospirillum sp.]MCF8489853.1 Flp pilus assembly complex ATPase component TadA [Rhodospirillum sp.]
MDLSDFLAAARARGASDIHLSQGSGPQACLAHARLNGVLVPLEQAPSPKGILEMVLDAPSRSRLEREGEADAAFTLGGGRVRLRASRARSGTSLFLRLLPDQPPTLGDLALPSPLRAFLEDLIAQTEGLILVTGASGSGKTTTAAALVDGVNRLGGRHVLTIEDPVEYLHSPLGGPVTQREIGADTPGFASALDAALRADPDVLLVGEARDAATMTLALSAAETGHLVLTTLHAASVPGAVDRVIDLFSLDHRDRAGDALASALTAIIHQRLLPRRGGGRILAASVLRVTPAVRSAIREGRTRDLAPIMAAGEPQGMVTEDRWRDVLFEEDLVISP